MQTKIVTGISLLVLVTAAHAVNFMDTPGTSMKGHAVDVDSIRKGNDGLVHFTEKNPMGLFEKAVDCQGRISYATRSPDWKSGGNKIIPGSYGALVADFVCSRAR